MACLQRLNSLLLNWPLRTRMLFMGVTLQEPEGMNKFLKSFILKVRPGTGRIEPFFKSLHDGAEALGCGFLLVVVVVVVVRLLSHVWFCVTPWAAACQASLSSSLSYSLLIMSIESLMLSTISPPVTPFSFCPYSFPTSGSFPMSQLFASGGQSIGVSASASVLPMNTQD